MSVEILNTPRIIDGKWRSRAVTALVIGLAIASLLFLAPGFLTRSNLINVLKQVAVPGIVALGEALVVLAGGFDLSVGAVAALTGVLAVSLSSHNLFLGVALPILSGAGIGAVNGLLICRASIHPLIVTLGIRYVVYAAAALYTHGFVQVNRSPEFLLLGRGSIAGLPVSALIFLAIIALGYVTMKGTAAGRIIYAIGNNERATFYCGIRTELFRILTYIVSGICAAVGGILLASRSGSAASDAAQGWELEALAAIAVGGVSLLGGAGTPFNVLLGVVVFGVLNNFLVLTKQPYEIHQIVVGGMIVVSLVVDLYLRRKPLHA